MLSVLLFVLSVTIIASDSKMPAASMKNAVLVLLCILLMRLFYNFHIDAPISIDPVTTYWIIPYNMMFYIVYPTIGFLADFKFGKIKVALVSAVFSLLISFLRLLGNILIDLDIGNEIIAIMFSVLNALSHSAVVCFEISMTSFGINQLVSASTLVLTSFIWWRFWIKQLGSLAKYLVFCTLKHTSVFALFVPEGIHIVSVLAVVISCCVFLNLKTFMRPSAVNSLALIAHVLNYARKTKYPKNRSALTYWLDDYPPRIDFGKTKYGGPFTEEEVENVKTFLRLLPVLLVILLVNIPAEPLGRFSTANNITQSVGECLISQSYFCHYVIAVILVPIKLIIFSRFRYKMKCFSTLFRLIGFGFFWYLLGLMMLPVFDYLARSSSNETAECLFSYSTHNITSTKYYFFIDYRLLIIPNAFRGLGAALILPSSFELLVAQAPIEMRGIIVGLFFSVSGLYEQMGWLLSLPFAALPSVWPSCEFYFFLVNIVMMVASLIGVILVGKWYKLRQRDDPFNPYSAVENFYDKDFDRRDKYMRYGALEQCDIVT